MEFSIQINNETEQKKQHKTIDIARLTLAVTSLTLVYCCVYLFIYLFIYFNKWKIFWLNFKQILNAK